MEDEVDWSDSPIGSPVLNTVESDGVLTGFESPDLGFQEDYGPSNSNEVSMELPVAETFDPYLNEKRQVKPAAIRRHEAEIDVRPNRRKPSRDDYSNFVLYQGSQKVYEATFLKKFVAHALHPARVEACLSDSQDPLRNIHQYFDSVSENVNKLAAQLISNTHSRTVRFMANDEKEDIPFWDSKQFDDHDFANFEPGNVFPVHGLMNQSWHRAFNQPTMVRYSAEQYQVGTHASPFEEIDDITGQTKLFEDRSAAHAASDDRVERHARLQKPKNHYLPGTRLREKPTLAHSNWLRSLPHSHSRGSFVENTGIPDTLNGGFEGERLPGVSPVHDIDVFSEHSEQDNSLSSLVRSTSDTQGEDFGSPSMSENMPSEEIGKRQSWIKTLIQDHKQRLASRWPQSVQARGPFLDFNTAVARALKSGAIRYVVPDPRRTANAINPPVEGPHFNGTRSGYPDTGSSHRGDELISEDSGLQTAFDTQQNIKFRTSVAEPTHSARGDGQIPTVRSKKRQKRDPKSKNSKRVKTPNSSKTHDAIPKFSITPSSTNDMSLQRISKTLEDGQQLPPDAYFESIADDEQPAWRCGINHPMGRYYNAGDRKNCAGCFTGSSKAINIHRETMDFYLPSRSHSFQPAPPGVVWKPGRPSGKPRRSGHLSHNSIAKDAYWEAVRGGATLDEALTKGIEAVQAYLHAQQEKKTKKKKKPTPIPTPEPVDLGPHPSGSETMEHGQDLPMGAYWQRQCREDEFAWRCDVNHALGRYYLAGDMRSCPGCGSSRYGPGQHPEMDFFMPFGTVARQQAPGLVKYKPRKAYNLTKKSKKAKQIVSHNQFCSKRYWELVEGGHEHIEGGVAEETLALAVQATEEFVDAKAAAVTAKLEPEYSDVTQPSAKSKGNRKQTEIGKQQELQSERGSPVRHSVEGARLFHFSRASPLIPQKRGAEVLGDSELDEVAEYESAAEDDEEAQQDVVSISSGDEDTSDSDSE